MTTPAPAPTIASSPDIVLIHGANGCRTEMLPWCEKLASQGFRPHAIDLAGHGGSSIPPSLSMTVFSDEVVKQLDRLQLQQPLLMGYSFGGIVALHVARHHPERVKGVVSLATKYVFDERTVQHFTHLLQVPRLSAMPHRIEHLSRIHQPNDWRELVEALHAFFASLGTQPPLQDADLQAITRPALVISGDSDPLVSRQETLALDRLLPHSEIALFNGKAHPAEAVPALGLAQAVRDWAKSQGFFA